MMKVIKSMYHRELQPMYGPGRMVASLLAKNWGVRLFNLGAAALKGSNRKGMQGETHQVPSRSTPGHQIRVRVFRPAGVSGPLPAMLYLHGGGYMVGVPEQNVAFYEGILQRRDVAIVAPAYRLSVKHPFPAGFDDCYDTLLWMKENAAALSIASDPYIIAGHSAGGGMTAALTLKARDTQEVKVAFQMPIYPMIDHRQATASSRMLGAPVWDATNNAFGWQHYLKGLAGQDIPAYASPALNQDYHGFPPTISLVADLEPFRDETTAYLEALEAAGVPTQFKLFHGAFHAFDTFAANTSLGRAANQFQWDAFAAYYDRYVMAGQAKP